MPNIIVIKAIKERRNAISLQCKSIKRKLKKLPKGTLTCALNGKYVKNYQTFSTNRKYISKKQRLLLQGLAQKKYLSAELSDLQAEEELLGSFLQSYEALPSEVEKLLNKPAYQKTISPLINTMSDEHSQWMYGEYEKNQNHPENLIHKCNSGHIVRSKSEALIDQALFAHQIPFRYEQLLTLRNIELHPDFTILHPVTGKIYYWEHCGKMDHPTYVNDYIYRHRLYISNGILPTINLILTYETLDHPLTIETIEKVIEDYFL